MDCLFNPRSSSQIRPPIFTLGSRETQHGPKLLFRQDCLNLYLDSSSYLRYLALSHLKYDFTIKIPAWSRQLVPKPKQFPQSTPCASLLIMGCKMGSLGGAVPASYYYVLSSCHPKDKSSWKVNQAA